MSPSVLSPTAVRSSRSLGVLDGLLVYVAPRRVFERVEDTGAYGWALVTLLGLTALLGYASVQTGLIDRAIDLQTERSLATLEQTQAQLVDRMELRNQMEDVRKQAKFTKLLSHLGSIVFSPASLLASCLMIASMLYVVVALTGRKPEYHSLTSICVYAAYIDLIALVVRFIMMIRYKTIAVDTSLGMLAPAGQPSPLAAIDPFRIWFWVLVGMGLITTRQLSRRAAVITCVLLALTAAGVRVAAAFIPRG